VKLERDDEERLVRYCRKNDILCLKLRIDGMDGFPDRTIIANGAIGFVEMKRKGNKPSKQQEYWLKQMKKRGFPTCVAYSSDEAIQFTESLI